jgi:hypothetical protein
LQRKLATATTNTKTNQICNANADLKLEADTADGTTHDTLHQVSGETGDLVAKALRGHKRNLLDEALVDLEVKNQARVVLLDKQARGLLDRLRANATLNNTIISDMQSGRISITTETFTDSGFESIN